MTEKLNIAAAVAAANTQISSNAIVRLASDVGSIYSMMNAADFESDLNLAIKAIYSKSNGVVYDAELSSQSVIEITANSAEDISGKLKALLTDMESLSEKLTEIVEQLAKFQSLIDSKKALNPLISDELVARVHTATEDGNNAKLLTGVSLGSINSLTAACQTN
jgi:hypothetical protein